MGNDRMTSATMNPIHLLWLPFCLLCLPLQGEESRSAPRPTFESLDTDNDSKLSAEELPRVKPDAFEHVDTDFDSALSKNEFRSYLQMLMRVEKNQRLIPEEARRYENIAYVQDGHSRQKLDLYLPAEAHFSEPFPLVIWIHGGGWRKGSKELIGEQSFLLEHGFAVASVNYRLTQHASFPAQVHDCKAAVRFLKAHASEYGLDPHRFGLWGASAGGHLVSLLGTSGDVKDLEGELGNQDESSRVQAVCDWFGVTDLPRMARPGDPPARPEGNPDNPITRFLGGPLSSKMDEAHAASPTTYISRDDPPFLIMHGSEDPLVPFEQSERFHGQLTQAGVDSRLITVEGAGHAFFKEKRELNQVKDFFNATLKTTPKLAVMETALGNKAMVESIEMAKRAGYSGIQLHTGNLDEEGIIPIAKPELIEAFKKASEDHNIEIVSLCAGEMNRHNAWNPESRSIALSIGRQSIEACAAIGTPILLVPFFGKAEFGNDTEDPRFKAVASLLRELLVHADKHDVVLGIECNTRQTSINHLIKMTDHPKLRVYYDTGNLLRSGEDIYQTIDDWGGETICQMHLKPFESDEGIFGDGKTDLPRLAKAIESSGYTGWLVFEAGPGKKTLGVPFARRNFEGIQKLCRELP